MNFPHNRIVLIPDANKVNANAAANEIAGEDQGDSFKVPLSADGFEPVTHWIMGVRLTDECLEAFNAKAPDFSNAIVVDGDEPGVTLASVIAGAGLQRVEDY